MGYQGVVNTQIQIYQRWERTKPKQEILNHLISSRIKMSWGEKEDATRFYGYLVHNNSKTLKDVIRAIVNYEYFESIDSKRKIARLPKNTFGINREEEISRMKKECLEYIDNRLKEMGEV